MKYWSDTYRTIYNASCRDMKELSDESIQCVVTSPPYWGLRKYAGEQTVHFNDGDYSYGLEPTPELYIAHSIEILREIRRVLRKDGVVFWNIGDSYNGSGGCHKKDGKNDTGFQGKDDWLRGGVALQAPGLKPKDLCLIPFRVAIAAQEDGWYVRSVIIWSKPNPMPESVKDRPTESHEYILLLTKNSRYFWDMEAVREEADYDGRHDTTLKPSGKYNDRNHLAEGTNGQSMHVRNAERWPNQVNGVPARNLRSVWTMNTQPYSGAHFATFPEELAERCIKAGSSEKGCCANCGKPYERIVEKTGQFQRRWSTNNADGSPYNSQGSMQNKYTTIGWQPSCTCGADVKPCTILDPFMGSGTTLKVAAYLGRNAVGYDISEEYCKLAIERNRQYLLTEIPEEQIQAKLL